MTAGAIRPITPPDLSCVTAKMAREYLDNTWALTDVLFSCLEEQAFTKAPYHGLRHPMIFYYGHVTCFYINKLVVAGLLPESINRQFEDLFEVGVDEMRWDDMSKNEMEWPSLAELRAYKREAYAKVCQVIDDSADLATGCKVDAQHPLWSLFMAIEHEHIHLETSSVLIRELPLEFVTRPSLWPMEHPSAGVSSVKSPTEDMDYPSNPLLQVEGETVTLGRQGHSASEESFGWDNEFGTKDVLVEPFAASKFMVTNGEFHRFVQDGGYNTREYWCEEGWGARSHFNRLAPAFWVVDGPRGSHQFKLRSMFEEIPMPWSWPVNVQLYEAKAYCKWLDAQKEDGTTHRVNTEAEHHLLRDGAGDANHSLNWGSHSPVTALPASDSGHHDVFGNGWEWTSDNFTPLDNFKVHSFYTDFSEPCFDGRHNIIMGGSFISIGNLANRFARYHFRPHFLQHSGFRVAHTITGGDDGEGSVGAQAQMADGNVYETDASVQQYLTLHYASEEESVISHENMPRHAMEFPARCAQLVLEARQQSGVHQEQTRALDLGCSVGRSTLELATGFGEVIGLDYSQAFVDAADRVKQGEQLCYSVPVEGSRKADGLSVQLPTHITEEVRDRVRFEQGDACDLRGDLGSFDAVLAANLVCRLPRPRAFLDRLPSLVKPGGIVAFTTPFSWLEEFTPREEWLGDGCSDSFEVMQQVMNENFELESRAPMPLLIREHARKYQYIVSDATVWRRRS